jgi:hypothetical protein
MEKRLAFGLSECVYIWVYKLHKSGIISFICSQVGNVLRDEGTAGYIFSLASQLRQITLGLHGPWYSSSYCATGKSRECDRLLSPVHGSWPSSTLGSISIRALI